MHRRGSRKIDLLPPELNWLGGSPDDAKLLLQQQNAVPLVFSFKSKRLSSFAHDGPADLNVLDWR